MSSALKVGWFLVAVLILVAGMRCASADVLVPGCEGLRRDVIRETYLRFGLNSSPARSIGQIQAESGCRAAARNRSGSRGLAQFMPGTARMMSRRFHAQLSEYTPFSPAWSIRAMLLYNKYHYDLLPDAMSACNRWAITLGAYNAGWGGVPHSGSWFGGVGRRAPRETQRYVARILTVLEPAYLRAGWPGERAC